MDRENDTQGVLAFGERRSRVMLRERAPGRNLLAVLTESTSDEWFRQWERSDGTAARLGLIECYELTRGGAAQADEAVAVSGALSLSTLERPIEPERLSDAVGRHLDEWGTGPSESLLYVESLEDLVADAGKEAALELFDRLGSRPGISDLVISADPETDAVRAVVELQCRVGETVGALEPDGEAVLAVTRLRNEDPTTFGYLTRHWREAVRAIEAADRTYPRAKQLHDAVDTELSPRMLGAALSGFARLGVIGLRGETNGPNRYDCRGYDPERAARFGLAAESIIDA